MSLILGALGGAGQALQDIGAANQKALIAQDQATLESNLAQSRAESLEVFKSNLATTTANDQREVQQQRIAAATGDVLNQGLVSRAQAARASNLPAYDGSTDGPASFHGDASQALAAIQSLPDGPDKQAALAQLQSNLDANKAKVGTLSLENLTDAEKAQFAPSDEDRAKARTQAAIQLGYISPKDAAELQSKAEINQVKVDAMISNQNTKSQAYLDVQKAHNEALVARTQAQYDAAMAKIEAGLAKAGNGNTDFDKKVALLKAAGATSKDIANFIMERKQSSLEDLANGFLKADPYLGDPKRQMTPDQALSKAKTLRELTQALNGDGPAPAPTTPPISALPPGAVQIGTSGGKPVYKTPDGKQFIAQ